MQLGDGRVAVRKVRGNGREDRAAANVGRGGADRVRIERDERAAAVLYRISHGAQKHAVVKNAGAESHYALPFFERVPGDAETRAEVVVVIDRRLAFVADAGADSDV